MKNDDHGERWLTQRHAILTIIKLLLIQRNEIYGRAKLSAQEKKYIQERIFIQALFSVFMTVRSAR